MFWTKDPHPGQPADASLDFRQRFKDSGHECAPSVYCMWTIFMDIIRYVKYAQLISLDCSHHNVLSTVPSR